ncbi:hypothetical protein H2200_009306 [Cladophialophora chaetospira]|uniref:PD-(D/E)XK nuclease-like domain-containing protein n=1 Tax=Cladophialophora chaetospira TaxID=386627 RepID=A0AA38X3Z0_9EURO|nr:hypothetical protein H2200_009306 [Cladophialophora chaetospira]
MSNDIEFLTWLNGGPYHAKHPLDEDHESGAFLMSLKAEIKPSSSNRSSSAESRSPSSCANSSRSLIQALRDARPQVCIGNLFRNEWPPEAIEVLFKFEDFARSPKLPKHFWDKISDKYIWKSWNYTESFYRTRDSTQQEIEEEDRLFADTHNLFLDAQNCAKYPENKIARLCNAQGLLETANLHGVDGQLKVTNLTAQSIERTLLPQLSGVYSDREIDIGWALNENDPDIREQMKKLKDLQGSLHIGFSPMNNEYTKEMVLGCGMVISGNDYDITLRAQLFVWLSSSIQNFRRFGAHPEGQPMPPFVGILAEGQRWHFYFACLDPDENVIYIAEGSGCYFQTLDLEQTLILVYALRYLGNYLMNTWWPWIYTLMEHNLPNSDLLIADADDAAT